MILDGKSSKEYPVNPQGSILGPTLFLLHINDFPDEVICNIVIYADETTLYFKCDKASDLWQQLNCGRKMLVDFNAGKTELVLSDHSNTGAIDVKMDESVFEEKSSFKMLGLTFHSKLDWGF